MTEEKKTALAVIEEKREEIIGVSDQIWEYAELSLKEFRSANLYCETLEKEGFHVEKGISGIETAFSASYGSGRPLIGILAEYDALSGLSQVAGSTERKERVAGGTGHGCGHNLLGAGAFAATLGKSISRKDKDSGNRRSLRLSGRGRRSCEGIYGERWSLERP